MSTGHYYALHPTEPVARPRRLDEEGSYFWCWVLGCGAFFLFILLAAAASTHWHDDDHDDDPCHHSHWAVRTGRYGGVRAAPGAEGAFSCPPGDVAWTAPSGDAVCRPDVVLPGGTHENMINTAVEPCLNFYEHANGAWTAATAGVGNWYRFFSTAEQLEADLADDILHGAALVSPWTPNPLGEFLRSCSSAYTQPSADDAQFVASIGARAAAAARRGVLAATGAWLSAGLPAALDVSIVASPARSGERVLLIAPGHNPFAHIPHHDRLPFATALLGSAERGAAALRIAEALAAADNRESIDSLDTASYVHDPAGWDAHTFSADALARAVPGLDWVGFRDAAFGARAQDAARLTHWVLVPAHLATLAAFDGKNTDWAAYHELLALSVTFEHLPGVYNSIAARPVARAHAAAPHGLRNRTSLAHWARPHARHRLYAPAPVVSNVAAAALPNLAASERCRALAADLMSDTIDATLAANIFTPELTARISQQLAANIDIRRERIDASPRLSPTGRAAMHAKFDRLRIRIGTPVDARGPPSSAAKFGRHHAANVHAILAARAERAFAGITDDFDVWRDARPFEMTGVVNAYYRPDDNTVSILNGIGLPPFAAEGYDDVVLAATVMSIVSHELSHASDPEGIRFDACGAVAAPFAAADHAAFNDWAACITNAYTGVDPVSGVLERGADTVTEASADVHGLTVALAALERVRGAPLETEDIRRFALMNAQMWAQVQTREAAERQARGDPHPLAALRVNRQLAQAGILERAYGCPLDTARCVTVM